jgi:hypothetical protein
MSEQLRSIFLGLSGIYVIAFIATFLAVSQRATELDRNKASKLIRVFGIGIFFQFLHSLEEFLTGFYIHWPNFLGLTPWPPLFFASFNLFWIAVWSLSIFGIRNNYHPAFFALWFFVVGMILNLIAHPFLALAVQGYFPGLITSPLVGITGLFLLRMLNEIKLKNKDQGFRI